MADTTKDTTKTTTTPTPAPAHAAAAPETSDQLSAADRKKLDPADPRAVELGDGDSKMVAAGGTGSDTAVPGVPVADKDRDAADERRLAGIPEPPKPALYTDLHLTTGGYQVTPAGVSPQEMEDARVKATRQ